LGQFDHLFSQAALFADHADLGSAGADCASNTPQVTPIILVIEASLSPAMTTSLVGKSNFSVPEIVAARK
jgi:hypothetical protein